MSRRQGGALRWVVRAYRTLLLAYPPGFRRRHGAEMTRLFRDRAQAAVEARGVRGLLGVLPGALRDLALNAPAEWLRESDAGQPSRTERRLMAGFGKDVRWAVRSLLRSPGFAVVAILTLAVGIGANTAIFSVVRAVLLEPLPYAEPERLVIVWGELESRGITGFPLSPPDFQDLRELTTSLEDVAAVLTFQQSLTGEGEPVEITLGAVSPNFFQVLGIPPMVGRDFVPSDGDPGDPGAGPGDPGFVNQVVILDAGLWRRRFGGDPSVVGRIIEIGGGPAEVVGIAPDGFRLLFPAGASVAREVDAWATLRFDYAAAPRGNVFLKVLGRLRPGVSLEQANQDMDRVAEAAREVYPGWAAAGLDFDAVPFHADVTKDVRPVILALMAAVGFVLLIACANVSNLLLVRASTRQRELSLRAALGGSRHRLVRQLLVEGFVLAGVGALVGVGLARLGIDLLLLLRPEELPRIDEVAVDGGVLAFTAAAAGAAALLFGLIPAIQASRVDLAGSLRERGRSGGLASQRLLRNGVVVGEVALSLVLLVGAGLMVRSFAALQRTDPGFEPEGVMTFSTNLPFQRYVDIEDRLLFVSRLRERLEGLPGVEAASGGIPLPLQGVGFNGRWGHEEDAHDDATYQQADYYAVLPGYFEAMGTRLLEGRDFTAADQDDSTAVVVVDETLARKAFPGGSAVGRRIHTRVSSEDPQIVEIIGVVEHQRRESLARPGREAVYFTHHFAGAGNQVTWAVRSGLDPASVAAVVRREVAELDPLLPVANLEPMSARVREAMAPTRFALVLIGVFGILALVLAAVGLYGVVAFTVRQRTAEIGVRVAFGAERGGILRMVVGQGVALAGAGVAVGIVAALAATGAMASLLVGVEPRDPATFVAVPLVFLAVAAVASLLPALRATRVDPVAALRED
ncbi:MAG: ABC transporter permease [Gemmatimonadetes bacterium]|nr:ABC transporter permease [Gemmatimonadota bacterium]